MLALLIGNPGETDADSMATLDSIYEVGRRGLFAFFVHSIFTPLHGHPAGDPKKESSKEMTALQWQILLKCWQMSINVAPHSWWRPPARRIGAFLPWLWKLRKTNGPAFTWPSLMVTSTLADRLMEKVGKIYHGRPLAVKSRKESQATIKPQHWKFLREDNGDLPTVGRRRWHRLRRCASSNPAEAANKRVELPTGSCRHPVQAPVHPGSPEAFIR